MKRAEIVAGRWRRDPREETRSDSEEITNHIEAGKVVTKLALDGSSAFSL